MSSFDPVFLWILLFGVLASVGALAPAGLVLLLSEGVRARLTPYLLSFATGTVLATALIGLLPEAMEQASVRTVSFTVLGGVVVFFVLESLVIWRHAHADGHGHAHHPGEHQHALSAIKPATLILIGDAFHNFVDGVAVAAAFLASPPLGVATAVAVIGHEIPQELGDFVLLLEGGFSRAKALLWNGLSGLATLAGALLAYVALAQATWVVPYALAVAASGFLYIGLADLVPGLHGRRGAASGILQFLMMLLGIAIIAFIQH
jgi:zinc and cadmium transporter